ncbi:MAG: hypothetical protein OXE77_08650 [Flavobacteriaceae bacterium]|nr:hypothetical protein [Flavobacteriaceae bacterium]MCY4267284.1 hypothetical protein [Flavobacteriaceae bacterium]
MKLSGKFVSHPEFKNYCNQVAGYQASFDTSEIIQSFLELVFTELEPYFGENKKISKTDFFLSLEHFPISVRDYFSNLSTSSPIRSIEEKIKNTSELRRESPLEAIQYGKFLINQSYKDLKYLFGILGKDNVKYQLLADKLSNEILQCVIDHFNKCDNSVQEDIQKLINYAFNIACGNQTKQRIQKNESVIKNWFKSLHEDIENAIKHQNYISEYCTNILNAITKNDIVEIMSLIDSAENIVSECKYKLSIIYNAYMNTCNNDLYVQISSSFVNVLLLLIEKYINDTYSLFGIEQKSLNLINLLYTFSMNEETLNKYFKYKYQIENLYDGSIL